MNIQRLRNLTTGKLHTQMSDFYEDLERISGQQNLMTHMLPRVLDSVTPFLRRNVTDPRFWDGKFDTSHVGEYDLPESTESARLEMFDIYHSLHDPLKGKPVIVVEA